MDERDLSRIRSDLYYVSKFIRHNRGNIDNAYNHMVSPMTLCNTCIDNLGMATHMCKTLGYQSPGCMTILTNSHHSYHH